MRAHVINRHWRVGLLEDVCGPAEEVLLLLVAVGAHASLDDGEEGLQHAQDQGAAALLVQKHLQKVQHLTGRDGTISLITVYPYKRINPLITGQHFAV